MWRSLQEVDEGNGGSLGLVVGNFSSFLFPNETTGINNNGIDLFSDMTLDDNSTDYNSTNTTTGNSTAVSVTSESEILRATFSTYGSAMLVILLVFCWARQRYPRVFNLRNWVEDRKTDLADNQYGFFSWLWQLYLIPDERMMMECGMDSVCFVRICSMGLKLCLVGMFCGTFLMPVYATAPWVEETKNVTDSIVELTTAHVGPGSPRLVSTALAAYVFFGFAMWLILTELEDWFIPMRHKFLMRAQPRNYAVFVRNIPIEYQSNRGLEHFFSRCLGVDASDIEAHIGLTTKHLKNAVGDREETLHKLEHALAEKEILGITPTHKVQRGLVPGVSVPGLGDKVDSITFFARELAEENQDVAGRIERLEDVADEVLDLVAAQSHEDCDFNITDEEEVGFFSFVKSSAQNAASNVKGGATALTAGTTDFVASAANQAINLVNSDEDGNTLSGGFVVFKKLAQTQAALQMIHHEKPFTMEVIEAPDPQDIFWGNVGRQHKDLQLGKLASLATTVVTCFLWTIPVAFVASLSSVEALRKEVPVMDNVLDALPFLVPVFEVLAPQFLVILNALLPIMLGFVTTFEGLVSGALLEASLFQKLSAFMIIQTFFVSALSGGILAEISSLLENPKAIVDLLAKSLPAQSTFFVQMSVAMTVTTFGVEGLRIVPVVLSTLRRFIGPRLTAKERDTTFVGLRPLCDPVDFPIGDFLSNMVLFFMILLVYAVIAPIVTFILAGCFAILGGMFRHHFVFIYPEHPDSGGQIWVGFIRIITKCLLVAEITVMGLLALKKATYATPLLLPLIIITILFQFYIGQKHWEVAGHLPSRKCLQRDRRNANRDLNFLEAAYIQPEMRDKEVLPDLPPDKLEELGLGLGIANGIESLTPGGIHCRVTKFPLSQSNLNEAGTEDSTGETSPLFADPETTKFNFDSV